jgi:hypothetical protein
MENYSCNCLLNPDYTIRYQVVWVNENRMTWIPLNVPWFDSYNNNRTVYWTRGDYIAIGPPKPVYPPPGINPVLVTEKK